MSDAPGREVTRSLARATHLVVAVVAAGSLVAVMLELVLKLLNRMPSVGAVARHVA